MSATAVLERTKSKSIAWQSIDSEIELLEIRKRLSIAEQEISEGKLLDHDSLKRMRGIA